MSAREDRRKQLAEELARLDEEDANDEDFEIEMYSSSGAGARVPYRKGKSWLAKEFGIDADSLPRPGAGESPTKSPRKSGSGSDAGDSAEGDANNLTHFQQRRRDRETG